jgi:anti-sigma-K factor RskA
MTHQQLIDSAASYALDALDQEERARFEAHLAGCADCRSEVAAYREVAGALAHAAPTTALPSPALRDRIMRDARQVRPIATAPRPVVQPVSPVSSVSNATPRRNRGGVIAWAVAAAAIAAALAFAFVYRGERDQAERLRRELAEAQATLAREDSTLSAFLGPEVHVVSLTAASEQKPRMRVFWNHTRRTFIVTALNLPPAPSGKTYQLWAIRKGKPPMSMGTFDPNPSGRTATTLAVAQDINDGGFIDDCALTVEPAGGSAQPTETPRLMGSWRHVD